MPGQVVGQAQRDAALPYVRNLPEQPHADGQPPVRQQVDLLGRSHRILRDGVAATRGVRPARLLLLAAGRSRATALSPKEVVFSCGGGCGGATIFLCHND